MKRLLLIAATVGMAYAQAFADVDCTGIVVDENGEPLVGVSIMPQGSSKGVVTDLDGKFRIRVADGVKNLEIKYVGYTP